MIPQRILILVDAMSQGGAQTTIIKLSKQWILEGRLISIVSLTGGVHDLVEKLRGLGVSYHEMSAKGMFDFCALLRLRKVILQAQPEQIHAHLYWSQIWAALLVRYLPITSLKWIEHNKYLSRSSFKWRLIRILYSRVTTYIAVSNDVKNFVRLRTNIECRVIPNPLEPIYFSGTRIASAPMFLIAGRLVEQKNVSLAIRAFSLALDRSLLPQSSRLLVAGDGPMYSQLFDLVERLGLSKSVIFMGFLSPEELASTLSKTTTLLITSHFEGGPIVGAEALASGCMVVTTKTGDAAEIAQSQGGRQKMILVDPSPEAVAGGLAASLTDTLWTDRSIHQRRSIIDERKLEVVAKAYLESFSKTERMD